MDKQGETGNTIDRLSDLPDGILCYILSHLPFRDVVRTAVLSTRWKCLFASVPCLDIDYRPIHDNSTERFIAFMDKVLLFRTSSVEKLRLRLYPQDIVTARFCFWIPALLRHGILELDLFIRIDHLPACMFTCKTLKVLKLYISEFAMNVPADVCFPNLKILHLGYIVFPNDASAQRLFSGCLVLEDLDLVNCVVRNISNFNIFSHTLKRLTIRDTWRPDLEEAYTHGHGLRLDTPSLVYFDYGDRLPRSYSFRNLESLEEVYIRARICVECAANYTTALYFMLGICNVKLLSLADFSMKLLSNAQKTMPMFHNLIKLEIDASVFSISGLRDWEGVANLLSNSPNLEILTIILPILNRCYPTWSRHKAMRFCSFSCLRTINIINFACTSGQMKMVKYFLENARILRDLYLFLDYCVSKEDQLKMERKLLKFPRRSSNCRVNVVSSRLLCR